MYDGWETRRRREPGFDWAIVRLGVPGIIHGVVVDTAFFKGNYPPFISVEATSVEGYPDAEVLDRLPWTCLVAKSPCEGDTENYYPIDNAKRWTHVRLNIFPDGGVARFRVHGEVVVDPRYLTSTVDLLAQENGGRLLDTSDAFYSSPENLILTHRARLMGEGWENAGGAARATTGRCSGWAPGGADSGRGRHVLLHRERAGRGPGQRRGRTLSDIDDASSWWDVVPRTPVLVDTRHRFLVPATGRRRTCGWTCTPTAG